MSEQNNTPSELNETLPKVEGSTTSARRRFLKKAAVGAPIVIASSATPAWGANCLSGLNSANVSNHEHVCTATSGKSPDFWSKNCVGNSDSHFKKKRNGDFKTENGKKILKNWCKGKENQYFYVAGAKSEDNFSGSDHRSDCQIGDSGHIGNMLSGFDEYKCHIAAAILNCQVKRVQYDYSLADITKIYLESRDTQKSRDKATKIFKQIHNT